MKRTHDYSGEKGLFDGNILHEFWRPQAAVAGNARALGFDMPAPGGSSAGRYFSRRSVGHLGFTGTSFWLDPEQDFLVILLTNRVHPTRRNERIRIFRPQIHDLIAALCFP